LPIPRRYFAQSLRRYCRALIVDGLAFMNLEYLVYQNMVGMRDSDGTVDDRGRAVVEVIRTLAAVLAPALLACYGCLAYAGKSAPEGAA
jgi:hypothetical protein